MADTDWELQVSYNSSKGWEYAIVDKSKDGPESCIASRGEFLTRGSALRSGRRRAKLERIFASPHCTEITRESV